MKKRAKLNGRNGSCLQLSSITTSKVQYTLIAALETMQTYEFKIQKRFWVRKVYTERENKDEYHNLVKELMLYDNEHFFSCFRMNKTTFEKLLTWLSPNIKKQTTKMRQPISPAERLFVCLRYLVTGEAQATIAASYRMSPSVVGRIVEKQLKSVLLALFLSNIAEKLNFVSTGPPEIHRKALAVETFAFPRSSFFSHLITRVADLAEILRI